MVRRLPLASLSLRNFPETPNLSIFSKRLSCKWEAYCLTNMRHIAVQLEGLLMVSLSSRLRSWEGTAMQIGGVIVRSAC